MTITHTLEGAWSIKNASARVMKRMGRRRKGNKEDGSDSRTELDTRHYMQIIHRIKT